jgi:hypothetical protein
MSSRLPLKVLLVSILMAFKSSLGLLFYSIITSVVSVFPPVFYYYTLILDDLSPVDFLLSLILIAGFAPF